MNRDIAGVEGKAGLTTGRGRAGAGPFRAVRLLPEFGGSSAARPWPVLCPVPEAVSGCQAAPPRRHPAGRFSWPRVPPACSTTPHRVGR